MNEHVASRENCQALQECGVVGEHSMFVHEWYGNNILQIIPRIQLTLHPEIDNWGYCPAYSLGELLRMLREQNINYRWNIAGEFECIHFSPTNEVYETYADTPEDAACLMAIWCKENGYLEEG